MIEDASTIAVRRAVSKDLHSLVGLFDAYREFYLETKDQDGSAGFLEARLSSGDSIILLGVLEGMIVGFVQLYPLFSSIRVARVFVLNDLYVAPSARGLGVATAMLSAARLEAKVAGAIAMTLSTGRSNLAAHAVYERNGWIRDRLFQVFELHL